MKICRKNREGAAAEDVEPACGFAGDGMQDCVLDRGFEAEAMLEPVVDALAGFSYPRHGLSPLPIEMLTSRAVLESVGIWPASMWSSPETIFQS